MAYDLSKLISRLPKDTELEAAQASDAEQGKWDRVSDTLSAAFTRTPYKATDRGPGQAERLTKGRAGALQALQGAEAAQGFAEENDPDSESTSIARQYATRIGVKVPEGATYASMKRSMPMLEQLVEREKAEAKLRAEQAAVEKKRAETLSDEARERGQQIEDRDLRIEAGHVNTRMLAGRQEEAEKRKEEREISSEARKSNVHGRAFLDPNVPPTPDDGKKVKEIDAATSKLGASLAKIEQLLAQHGTFERAFGSSGEELKSAYQVALDQYRVIAGLGVPSGPDTQLMDNALKDPTSFWNAVKGKGSASLRQMREASVKLADEGARDYGYDIKGSAQNISSPLATPKHLRGKGDSHPSKKLVPIINRKTGERLQIPPEDIEDAAADGFVRE